MDSPAAPATGKDERSAPATRGGARASVVRRHNLGLLLECLHLEGPASRSELGATTGLSRSTVADLVHELVRSGLVVEDGVSPSSGPGRPSPIVRLRGSAAVAVVVELGVDAVSAAVIGLGGDVVDHRSVQLAGMRVSPEDTVRQVADLVRGMDIGPTHPRAVGLGVAVPGLVRRADGFVHVAPNLGWKDVALGGLLAEAFDVPLDRVRVGNEADLGAVGEHRRGAGRGCGHLVFISGEVGIGAGLIIGGQPMLGAAGYAGEAGHMLVNPDGRPCTCGSSGCWETEVGESALLRAAGVRDVRGLAAVDAVLTRVMAGDAAATAAVAEIGHWLGVGVGNITNLLNPEVVVLGGILQPLFPFVREPMLDAMHARCLGPVSQPVRVVPSALGTSAQLHGAAEVVLASVLADPTTR
ncbi:Sugar kinase of the NBD/HSP70 family, may contain an N-terminal HTH domain [Nocardioides alpinus]|nr:ROK family protein [Nocardioides alpinus]SFB46636.1 Sugar kinase of the NBD/HSP70 family, may contain an N-terminal HTH domain [Nocardioides alpinus]